MFDFALFGSGGLRVWMVEHVDNATFAVRAALMPHRDSDGEILVEARNADEAIAYVSRMAGVPANFLDAAGST